MQEAATHLARRSGGETWCGLSASGVTLAGHGDPWKPVGHLLQLHCRTEGSVRLCRLF